MHRLALLRDAVSQGCSQAGKRQLTSLVDSAEAGRAGSGRGSLWPQPAALRRAADAAAPHKSNAVQQARCYLGKSCSLHMGWQSSGRGQAAGGKAYTLQAAVPYQWPGFVSSRCLPFPLTTCRHAGWTDCSCAQNHCSKRAETLTPPAACQACSGLWPRSAAPRRLVLGSNSELTLSRHRGRPGCAYAQKHVQQAGQRP